MKIVNAINTLQDWDRRGVYLYSKADLGKLLGEAGHVLTETIRRLVAASAIERVARNLYLLPSSQHIDGTTIEAIAARLRRGDYSYISLESAASLWGLISQVPVGRLTVMTTGREGEFSTPFGTIEFVHTEVTPKDILAQTIERPGHELRLATKQRTLRDLQTCHRSENLIDWEETGDEEA